MALSWADTLAAGVPHVTVVSESAPCIILQRVKRRETKVFQRGPNIQVPEQLSYQRQARHINLCTHAAMRTTMVAATAVVLACLISATSTAGTFSYHVKYVSILHQLVGVKSESRAAPHPGKGARSCCASAYVFPLRQHSHRVLQNSLGGANMIHWPGQGS